MSGVVGAVGTVFQSVTSTVANVGSAIMGVGSALFTGGAATGASAGALGGMFSGTLGNILGGAIQTGIGGALMGGLVGAVTGQGFGRGAMIGGLGGAVMGGLQGAGLFGAVPGQAGMGEPGVRVHNADGTVSGATTGIAPGNTPTGFMSLGGTQPASANSMGPSFYGSNPAVGGAGFTGVASPAPGTAPGVLPPPRPAGIGGPAPAASGGGGLMSLFGDNTGHVIAGLGQGLSGYLQMKEASEQRKADREAMIQRQQMEQDFTREERLAREANYRGMPTFAASEPTQGLPTPAQQFGRTSAPRTTYRFDPAQGILVPVTVAG